MQMHCTGQCTSCACLCPEHQVCQPSWVQSSYTTASFLYGNGWQLLTDCILKAKLWSQLPEQIGQMKELAVRSPGSAVGRQAVSLTSNSWGLFMEGLCTQTQSRHKALGQWGSFGMEDRNKHGVLMGLNMKNCNKLVIKSFLFFLRVKLEKQNSLRISILAAHQFNSLLLNIAVRNTDYKKLLQKASQSWYLFSVHLSAHVTLLACFWPSLDSQVSTPTHAKVPMRSPLKLGQCRSCSAGRSTPNHGVGHGLAAQNAGSAMSGSNSVNLSTRRCVLWCCRAGDR